MMEYPAHANRAFSSSVVRDTRRDSKFSEINDVWAEIASLSSFDEAPELMISVASVFGVKIQFLNLRFSALVYVLCAIRCHCFSIFGFSCQSF